MRYESSSKKNSQHKSKKSRAVLKSTRFTSPNSYQSSEIVSKKQSREKSNLHKKNNKDSHSNTTLLGFVKKKNKTKINLNNHCKQQDKENKNKNGIDSIIAQNFKITKWKNKILK